MERRRQNRNSSPISGEVNLAIERNGGEVVRRTALLVDVSAWGVGLETPAPMVVGAGVSLWGAALPDAATEESARRAQVIHCRLDGERYRTGCAFEDAPASPAGEPPAADSSLTDYYEILQLSPGADADTIHRVYRILAQRYHPDNPDTGDTAAFQNVLQAHDVLSNPERRAAYDVRHQASRALRWRIFQKPEELRNLDGERRIRNGILQALYAKVRNDPNDPGMTVRDFEDLLGCPSEHLRFPLWYVRQKNWIVAGDQGRYSITIAGVERTEEVLERDGTPGGPGRTMIELPEAKAG